MRRLARRPARPCVGGAPPPRRVGSPVTGSVGSVSVSVSGGQCRVSAMSGLDALAGENTPVSGNVIDR